ncbi:MAG: FHA domain-containing protein [Chloroflexales bacterium]|nr:FHA domain-containing protein [Chloroflexales bacterium]
MEYQHDITPTPRPGDEAEELIIEQETIVRELAPAPVAQAWLIVLSGPAGPRLHQVGARGALLGRAPDCDLVLEDPAISRRHAVLRLQMQEGGSPAYVLTDLGSSNGTLVNGEKVATATLANNDRVRLGGTELAFKQLTIEAGR